MKIKVRGYITHKESEKYSDCEDRYAINTANNRFAIADGVSKSFFPHYWANILVNNFVNLENEEELGIEKCQNDWLNEVIEKLNLCNIKWYTKNAFARKEPALATFVGLHFRNEKWFAHALGDSFLFFIPSGNTLNEWKILSSKEEPVVFDCFPDYYSSRGKHYGEVKRMEGDLIEGTFYLMTDALAEWLYNYKEVAVEEIKKWHTQDEFECSIRKLRALAELNNDDIAILIINLEYDGENIIAYETEEIQVLDELIRKDKEEKKTNECFEEIGNEAIRDTGTHKTNVEI